MENNEQNYIRVGQRIYSRMFLQNLFDNIRNEWETASADLLKLWEDSPESKFEKGEGNTDASTAEAKRRIEGHQAEVERRADD